MTRARFESMIPAALGLALCLPISASGQPGPGLSSGSGQGTGTGMSSGIQRNQSGSVSGVGPGPAGGRGQDAGMPGRGGIYPQPRSGFSVDMGPGVDTTFPDDTTLFPFSPFAGEAARTDPPNLTQVQPRELEFARSIADPGDRSLTLQRVANVAIYSNQLDLAHRALTEAASAVLSVTDPVVRDLRLIALISALDNLADAHLREGKMDMTISDPSDEPAPLPAKAAPVDRTTLISRAELEWRRAAHLAARIANPTYRSEMLYRVADSQAFGSQTIVNEFPHGDSSLHGESPTRKPDPLDARADQLLVSASAIAKQIGRPVWRDRALVAVATAAAQSRQYARGLQVARMIPQPEVRTDALVKIAESQARRDDPDGATATYLEAARAVASIPLDDPRAVLAGVLIDNLISVGRFDDARRVVVLYPDNSRRLIALGAVAESQGFRGAVESAIQWITKEVPAENRPFLYRRLRFGMLAAIEQNRSRSLEPAATRPGS